MRDQFDVSEKIYMIDTSSLYRCALHARNAIHKPHRNGQCMFLLTPACGYREHS